MKSIGRIATGVVVAAVVTLTAASSGSAVPPSAPVVRSTASVFGETVRHIGAGTTIADQTDAYLVRGAKSVCTDIDNGATRASFWSQVHEYYTPWLFDAWLSISVRTYCPNHVNIL